MNRSKSFEESSERFLDWMHQTVMAEGRGDAFDTLSAEPRGSFWLGRLAPEISIANNPIGKRAEKLDPCAIGIRVRPASEGPWKVNVSASFVCWSRVNGAHFEKSPKVEVGSSLVIDVDDLSSSFLQEHFARELAVAGLIGRGAEIRVEVETWRGQTEIVISLVNVGEESSKSNPDTHLYQAELRVEDFGTVPFELEALPDSFRYDRLMPAIGVNCGVETRDDWFCTADAEVAKKYRPVYWTSDAAAPDLSFSTLASDPLQEVASLLASLRAWGQSHWSREALDRRSSRWTEEMRAEAFAASIDFWNEVDGIHRGLTILQEDALMLKAFKLANDSMAHAANERYPGWRPFQVGFLVSALKGLVDPADFGVVDTVWFATGGGKTETYLGLLVTSILYDRLTGKESGISAWSRFPLRMLSLQQTQRFADALAGAELARRRSGISGSPIALGFFVGSSSTPNKIDLEPSHGAPNSLDIEMPDRYQVLLRCPFCHTEELSMGFDRGSWRLEHRCNNVKCPWTERSLPFFVVDQEIYRFLPSAIVGTLDKAAMVGMQAAMRGFFGPPLGICDQPGHGYCYSPRSATPSGCLVPGCRGNRVGLSQPSNRWAPSLRLQDELHLLRDSLGAVDAHYESLLDHLQEKLAGRRAKVVASSATLTGFDRQVDVLYRRSARVFPQPGPSVDESFWSQPSQVVGRTYVAIAPRGVTMEFVNDRTLSILQECVRKLIVDPRKVVHELSIPEEHLPHLLDNYGVNVVYGNTVRDVEAARRSSETQVSVEVNAETLTGGTQFEDVRKILDRLDHPEAHFSDRIHIVAASSMISHGVDIDRLNTMVMLGLPLTTAEFIQSSARVGRRWPGIVYVIHRLTREREAATYAQFSKFVTQGDRFIEPIPITRASRRVLAITTPGIVEARRLAIHEPGSGGALTTVKKIRDYYRHSGISANSEWKAIVEALGLEGGRDEHLRADLGTWLAAYFATLDDPATQAKWPGDLSPSGSPMRSLRDVEEAVPVIGEE